MDNSNLGTRMKSFENVNRHYLQPRTPFIIRLDGKSFHSYTKHCTKPFDLNLWKAFNEVCQVLLKEIQGSKLVYTQSDEVSVLITDYDTYETQAWFDKNIQKMVSVSASIATAVFNKHFEHPKKKLAFFDSRVFCVPKEDICNYFYWRQLDATRNSIQSLGQFHFSHKELHKQSCNNIQELLWSKKNINWNDCQTIQKRGTCFFKQDGKVVTDLEIPLFNKDRDYIEKYL